MQNTEANSKSKGASRFGILDLLLAVFTCGGLLAALNPQYQHMNADSRRAATLTISILALLLSAFLMLYVGALRRSLKVVLFAGVFGLLYVVGCALAHGGSIEENERAARTICEQFSAAQSAFDRARIKQPLKESTSLRDFVVAGKIPAEVLDATGGWSPQPYNGYCFRVLRVKPAPAERVDTPSDAPAMALVAFPAAYGKTGRRSFLAGSYPSIQHADLGPDTDSIIWKAKCQEDLVEFVPIN